MRLLHGKGMGALRETVPAILRKLPAGISFHLADESGGGWGATLVQLRGTSTSSTATPGSENPTSEIIHSNRHGLSLIKKRDSAPLTAMPFSSSPMHPFQPSRHGLIDFGSLAQHYKFSATNSAKSFVSSTAALSIILHSGQAVMRS